ncbi:MAG: hypothetical protein GC206_00835 [Alphaproteobacteria bacterium]|nr:hypothetical protein [Alphaproteobacteria bacterium]
MMIGRPGLAGRAIARGVAVLFCAAALAACENTPDEPTEPPTLIERGRQIFFTETFDGNGRTCGTCHRAEDNFGLSPNFIATLPLEDPLFVAETVDALKNGFEAPVQMRAHGLIRENLDGFEDLETIFTLRGVPHTLALRTSIASPLGPRTGWSGDGAPGDGSLRAFSVGAVIQHFPKSTNRVAGVDFRLPTEEELDALEAFMLSIGRQEEIALPIQFRDPLVMRGQAIFMDNAAGRCNVCHFNAGANGDPRVLGPNPGNLNFNTGVEDLPDLPSHVTGQPVPPRDDGFGIPGDGTFNTPPLVEAADTGPFFHNNAVATIEEAVGFYNSAAFNNSPAGQLIRQATGSGIALEATQVQAIASFLRAINALENIREATARLQESLVAREARAAEALLQTRAEIDDAIEVLSGASLSGDAVLHLREARRLSAAPRRYDDAWRTQVNDAVAALERARTRILAPAD